MGTFDTILPIKNIIGGIVTAFLAIMGIRITYPIIDALLGFWTTSTQMRVVAILIMWMVYVFILWVFVWMKFFNMDLKALKGGNK